MKLMQQKQNNVGINIFMVDSTLSEDSVVIGDTFDRWLCQHQLNGPSEQDR